LGEVFLRGFNLKKSEVAAEIEQVQGVTYVECPPKAIAPEVLALVPRALALRCCALPLQIKGKCVIVAMAEPQDLVLLDELRFSAGMPISPRFSFREDILAGIKKFYSNSDGVEFDREGEGSRAGEEKFGEIFESDSSFSELEFITASTREESREALKEFQAGLQGATLAV